MEHGIFRDVWFHILAGPRKRTEAWIRPKAVQTMPVTPLSRSDIQQDPESDYWKGLK